jgi:aspartyl aminopeptidase
MELTEKSYEVNKNQEKDYSEKINQFIQGYKNFLDVAKTEREFVDEAQKILKQNGFVNLDDLKKQGKDIEKGMKVYKIGYNKTIAIAVIGNQELSKGINVVGSHIDSPRLDLKQNPFYESEKLAMMKTHYYGAVKKNQWTQIPLALHGIVVKNDGSINKINIGEDEKDPVFTITDLLPHLSKNKPVEITGENLNLVLGSVEKGSPEGEKLENNVLNILKNKYGIDKEDFLTAELEVVPAFKARDVGIDRSMIGSYGQDDRSCSYAGLKAIVDIKNPEHTAVCYLSDKEEIGSMGVTGAQSNFFDNFVSDLCMMEKNSPENPMNKYFDKDTQFKKRLCVENSRMLSADVTAAVDPTYSHVHDPLNATRLGDGLIFMKYTGCGGKYDTSDANVEYFSEIARLLKDKNVDFKHAELGKVDEGGGGTIAQHFANKGFKVIDCGPGVLGMHSPFEVTNKHDLFSSYRGFRKFFKIDNYQMNKSENKDKTRFINEIPNKNKNEQTKEM